MMRSMFSGVSGLRAHQVKMDSIGNNIANVNTVGYKGNSVTFQEVYSQMIKGAGSPQGGRSGTNPQQVGLGVTVAAMDVNHTQGSAQRTDNPTDLMISGNGYFVVTNDPNYQNRFYTRAGNFIVDELGYLATASGFKVLGTDFKPIRIDRAKTKAATETDKIEIGGNIGLAEKVDTSTNVAYSTTFDAYDSLGTVHKVTVNFGEKISFDDGTNKATYRNIQFSNGNLTPASAVGDLGLVSYTPPTPNANAYYAKFNESGEFVGIFNNLTLDPAGYATADQAVNNLDLKLSIAGASDVDLKLYDTTTNPVTSVFRNLSHFDAASAVKCKTITGRSSGALDNFNVSESGEIIGSFTNGETDVINTIGLCDFDNNTGLQKVGSNLFKDTANSGSPKYGVPGTSSFGKIVPGMLEMSNVDLSLQFTEMITTQRGFQANSRVITTTDEMLQELVNLKR